MNENINLCVILKDCPKGTKLYSPLFGEVDFLEIRDKTIDNFPIKTLSKNGIRTFRFDGRYELINKECLLFPSKEQRDWSKWKCPKPKFDPNTLKPFDSVIVKHKIGEWKCGIFSNLTGEKYYVQCIGCAYSYCIPYNEDTKHLVGTSDEAPEYYRYWED